MMDTKMIIKGLQCDKKVLAELNYESLEYIDAAIKALEKLAAMESQKPYKYLSPCGELRDNCEAHNVDEWGAKFEALYKKPAQADNPAVDWPQINELVTGFIDDYHYAGDSGYYCPTEWEKALITDCIVGLLDELPLKPAVAVPDDFVALPAKLTDAMVASAKSVRIKCYTRDFNGNPIFITLNDTEVDELFNAFVSAAPSHSQQIVKSGVRMKPHLAGDESIHFMNCNRCGKSFDMRNFHEVMIHEKENCATMNTAGNRNPEARYRGYKGEPLPKDSSDDDRAAWIEGSNARLTPSHESEQGGAV